MYRMIVELTNRCNLNCLWCGSNIGWKSLSYKDAIETIDRYRPRHISITGGEPFLYKKLTDFIDYCKTKKIKVDLTTNGTLITKSIAKRLNADLINVSIDGLEHINDIIRGEGSFRKAERGINFLIESGKNVGISTALSKINRYEASHIIKYFYPKVRKFIFGRVISIGRATPEMCLSFKEAMGIWSSLWRYRINPKLKVVFSVQYWQLPGPASLGPVLLADKNIGHCCVRYNEIIGDLKNTKRLHSTNCLFCKGCGAHAKKSSS